MATKKAAKTTRKTKASKTTAKKSRAAVSKKAAAKRTARARTAKRTTAPAEAPMERAGLIEVGGKAATVIGADVVVGQTAPAFSAQVGAWPGLALWQEVAPLTATARQVRILAAVPSLDTNTCNLETRRFNQEAAALDPDIVIITISTDLPPAQARWCGAAGVERVQVVSDHMAVEFGVKYGTLIKERRYLRRAVFVVDRDDVVVYAAYMPKLGDEPDYAAVLAAARQALAEPPGAIAK